MNWHLGRYRFNADDICYLLSGNWRTAYVAVAAGGLFELRVSLTPEQAGAFMHGRKVRFEATMSGAYLDASPGVRISLDLEPPRNGERRYADGQNCYAADKRQARARALQFAARRSLQAAQKFAENGKPLEAANFLGRFYEDITSAWLEAEGYLPWLATTQGPALEFAIGAYANAEVRKLTNAVRPAAFDLPLLLRWPQSQTDPGTILPQAFVDADALAANVHLTVLRAAARGWPMIGHRRY
ncbi:MAG: hypothetical protein ABI451_11755 [Dokdonella sp.]